MIVGYPTCPLLMAFTFDRLEGFITRTEARHPQLDYYRSVWDFDCDKFGMSWVPNKTFLERLRLRGDSDLYRPSPENDPGEEYVGKCSVYVHLVCGAAVAVVEARLIRCQCTPRIVIGCCKRNAFSEQLFLHARGGESGGMG